MVPKSPFKFLDSYSIEDRDIFFGRENEIEEIYSKVFRSKILLIYGGSGTGKSSLVSCGLANKFQKTEPILLIIHVKFPSDRIINIWLNCSIKDSSNVNFPSLTFSNNSMTITKLTNCTVRSMVLKS